MTPEAQTTLITVLDSIYNMFRDAPLATTASGTIVAIILRTTFVWFGNRGK